MVTVSLVETLGLTLLSRAGRQVVGGHEIGQVQVGDVVLQAVVQVVLLRQLADDPRPLALTTVVDTGVRTVGQGGLGPFTLSNTGLHLSGEFSGHFIINPVTSSSDQAQIRLH